MKNKYPLPVGVREAILALIRTQYIREQRYKEKKDEILNGSGENYISLRDEKGAETERVYISKPKGGKNISETEKAGMALVLLDEEVDAVIMKIIQLSLKEAVSDITDPGQRARLKKALIYNLTAPRTYPYYRLYVPGMSHRQFYNYRNRFIYLVAKKIIEAVSVQ